MTTRTLATGVLTNQTLCKLCAKRFDIFDVEVSVVPAKYVAVYFTVTTAILTNMKGIRLYGTAQIVTDFFCHNGRDDVIKLFCQYHDNFSTSPRLARTSLNT